MKQLAERGEPLKVDRHLALCIYPDSYSEIDVCEDVVFGGGPNDNSQGVKGLCDELYRNGTIGYYELYRYTGSKPNINPDDYAEFKDEFDTWFEEESGYDHWSGCHLGIASGITGGRADWVGAGQPPAFQGTRTAIATTGWSAGDNRTANNAVHEVLHTLVNDNLDDVDDMINDDGDHDLGNLRETNGGDGAASPLLGGYGSGKWNDGECDSGNVDSKDEYWTTMNQCEQQATDYTADDAY